MRRSHRGRWARAGAFWSVLLTFATGPVAASEPDPARLVPEIRFVLPSPSFDNTRYEAGMLIAREWERLGLKVQLISVQDWPNTAKRIDYPWENHVFMAGYISGEHRLDPDELLYRPFHSSLIRRGGSNYAGYSNPEYDALADQARATLDVRKRREIVWRLQEILARDLPHITLYHKRSVFVYNKTRWKDAVPIPAIGLFNIFNIVSATPLTPDATMVVSAIGTGEGVNPFDAPSNTTGTYLQRIIFDTLVRVGPDAQPVPWAADRWTPVSPTTVDVHLRPAMKFHDGQPVTAEDVKFSYDEMSRWKVPLYAPLLRPIKQVRVLDPLGVRFELERPYAPLYMQTFSMVPIVPRHLWDGVVSRKGLRAPWEWNEPQAFIGSGPFKFVHYRPGQELKLARNEEHHHAPKARFWVLTYFGNTNAEFLAFKKGIVDFHTSRGLTPPQMVEARSIRHLATVEMDDIGVYFMEFNLRENSPFRNHAFRHALAHTIDYTTIVKSFLAEQAVPGRGIIAPANKFWHNPHVPSAEVEGPHYHQYDPAKARRILQEAGYEWNSRGRLHYPKNYRPQVLPRGAGVPAHVRTAMASGQDSGR